MKTPRPVSVIMPVFNAAPYLSEAVESILNQTFRNFEFIIINDGSTDGSSDILEHYSHIDRRITVYHQGNKGLIHALNRAYRLAQGPLLARMDADDISFPTRLERQVAFLQNHPEVGVLGSWYESFSQDKEKSTLVPLPTQPLSTAWSLLFGTPVHHPTVILRKELLKKSGYYRETAPFIEDRDLWLRMSKITKLMNLPEVLLRYRIHNDSICVKFSEMQSQMLRESVRENMPAYIEKDLKERSFEPFYDLFIDNHICNKKGINTAVDMLIKMYISFKNKNKLDAVSHCEIKKDIIEKLLVAAKMHIKYYPDKGLKLLLDSFSIDGYITTRRLYFKLLLCILPEHLSFSPFAKRSRLVSVNNFCENIRTKSN